MLDAESILPHSAILVMVLGWGLSGIFCLESCLLTINTPKYRKEVVNAKWEIYTARSFDEDILVTTSRVFHVGSIFNRDTDNVLKYDYTDYIRSINLFLLPTPLLFSHFYPLSSPSFSHLHPPP